MASKTLLTYGSKISTTELIYFAPISTIQDIGGSIASTYCVLAKPEPWEDDENPDEPKQSQKYLKDFQKKAGNSIKFLITNGLGHNKVYKTQSVIDEIIAFLSA